MNVDSLITFCGWAALTYFWLHTNFVFFEAIGETIQKHNNKIREKEQWKQEAIKQKAYREG